VSLWFCTPPHPVGNIEPFPKGFALVLVGWVLSSIPHYILPFSSELTPLVPSCFSFTTFSFISIPLGMKLLILPFIPGELLPPYLYFRRYVLYTTVPPPPPNYAVLLAEASQSYFPLSSVTTPVLHNLSQMVRRFSLICLPIGRYNTTTCRLTVTNPHRGRYPSRYTMLDVCFTAFLSVKKDSHILR